MAAGNTYVALATNTLSSATASVTFSSISGAYTDLVLVLGSISVTSSVPNIEFTFNGDTSTNYSATFLEGTGSAATSSRRTSRAYIEEGMNISLGGSSMSNVSINIMNYSNTTTNKTTLIRTSEPSTTYPGTAAVVGMWRNTNAINSIRAQVSGTTFATGTTFSLYGILAA